PAALRDRLRAALPATLDVKTGAQAAAGQTNDAASSINSFLQPALLAFGGVAVFVGAFIIFNAFSITVAQRVRENALLRALGATRRQVRRSVLLEAGMLGLIASVVGLALGAAVAVGLEALLRGMGVMDLPLSGLQFTVQAAVTSAAVGLGVTVVAALVPARRAGRVAPMAALHEAEAGSTGYGSARRAFVGLAVLAGGATAVCVGLLAGVAHPVAVVGAGAAAVLFAVALLARAMSLPLSEAIGWPLARLRGVSGTLARQNAMRDPKRTAATASALMICVGLIGAITIFASSAKASINAIVDRAFTGDFVIDSGAGVTGGFDPALARRLDQLPEVAAATGLRLGVVKIGSSVVQIDAVDPAKAFRIWDVKPLAGSATALGPDAIAVHTSVAKDKGLHIGSTLPVTFKDTGTKPMRVALIYGYNQPAGNYFLGMSAYEANFAAQYDSYVFVKKAAGASTASALAAVTSVTKGYPGAKVMDESQYKAEAASGINQLLGLVYVLLLLAVVIALLGIGNTLGLSVHERTHELGLMRAVGMTRRQLRSSIRWESVIVSVQGALLGLLVGGFFGWAMVDALRSQGQIVFSVPYVTLLAVVVLAAVAGVLAAAVPARRAAKLDVLAAMATE
ncbi:MAG TPA: FtsX-like permease family protein, partial [Acidimicrobiales bacterium]|nr:FtsX-like permease family protein [Acidimicrobiales bacterium]